MPLASEGFGYAYADRFIGGWTEWTPPSCNWAQSVCRSSRLALNVRTRPTPNP
jgi:hypothetical protein